MHSSFDSLLRFLLFLMLSYSFTFENLNFQFIDWAWEDKSWKSWFIESYLLGKLSFKKDSTYTYQNRLHILSHISVISGQQICYYSYHVRRDFAYRVIAQLITWESPWCKYHLDS